MFALIIPHLFSLSLTLYCKLIFTVGFTFMYTLPNLKKF